MVITANGARAFGLFEEQGVCVLVLFADNCLKGSESYLPEMRVLGNLLVGITATKKYLDHNGKMV